MILIDYQPGVMTFVRSHDIRASELNARYLTKAALAFDIPIILSTVGVQLKDTAIVQDIYPRIETGKAADAKAAEARAAAQPVGAKR